MDNIKDQAMAYLKEKHISDVKDELLIMKMSHLLSIPKVRIGIMAGIDVLIFLGMQFVTNAVKGSFADIKNVIAGNPTFSFFSIWNLLNFKHSIVWYLAVGTVLTVFDIRMYFMIYTNYRDINKNQKGSVRWSTLSEIEEQYPSIPLKAEKPYETFFGKGGVPICQVGTFYNDKHELCNIDKGKIFIDRTPVNNLIIGITRSGKGEMYVFPIIDIYSRAESKQYLIQYNQEKDKYFIYASNIYYDYREDSKRKTDMPVRINERQLALSEKDLNTILQKYVSSGELDKSVLKDNEYDFDKLLDMDEGSDYASENVLVSTKDRVIPKRINEGQLELALFSRSLKISDKSTSVTREYPFDPTDAASKKNALDEAFLYLSQVSPKFSDGKYEQYRELMGFEFSTIQYKKESDSDIFDDVDIEEESFDVYGEKEESVMDGIMEDKADSSGPSPFDILEKIGRENNINKFEFDRNYQASLVVSDPKLELFTASKPILELRGYDVYCINLINPYESSCYNPLQLITDTYKSGDPAEASAIARSLATSIFAGEEGKGENAFFYDNAAFLTAALIMSTVIDEVRADIEDNKQYLKEHKEATKRYQNLSDNEKERIDKKAEELSELRKKRRKEKDKFQIIQLDKEINAITKELGPYNYEQKKFKPKNTHEKYINLPNVLIKFTRLAETYIPPQVEGAEPRNALDLYFESRDALDVARNLYSSIKIAGGERTKGSVYSTVLSKLTGFMDDKIKKMTAYSSFQLTQIGFGERPVAVFLALPDFDNSNTFIQSIFISQTYYALAKRAIMNGGKCSREVIFLLDEFGNIPAIDNMSSMITVCLGRNIRFNLVVQAYSQLDKEYGEHDADTIYGNCGNQIYIQTDNYKTAEQFSNLIGKETIVNVTRMGGELSLTIQKQYTESTEEKPLLNPNELMEFVEGECVIKRVMMRKDQYNNKVKPRPIYNTGKTSFPLRYQYLSDWYNTENKWENLNADSCAKLNLAEYVSDHSELIKNIEVKATPEYQEFYNTVTEEYTKNMKYEIGSFIHKNEIEELLRMHVPELDTLSSDKLYKLTIKEIEEYYIRYESNLPDFRQCMYSVSDWSRKVNRKADSFGKGLIDYFKLVCGEKFADIMELYEMESENSLKEYSVEELLEILEEQEIPENNIIQFSNAIKRFEGGDESEC